MSRTCARWQPMTCAAQKSAGGCTRATSWLVCRSHGPRASLPRVLDEPLFSRATLRVENLKTKHLEVNMPEQLPEKYADLLKKKAFANLGTLNGDGSPQVTPVWVDYDGKHVRVNTALGRVKDKNMRRDPRVSLSIQDPENPYRYLEIR